MRENWCVAVVKTAMVGGGAIDNNLYVSRVITATGKLYLQTIDVFSKLA